MILLLFSCIRQKCNWRTKPKQLGSAWVYAKQAFRCSAIAEFSAGQPSLLTFNSLASNPLENVWGTIAQFDLLILAITQEPNGRQIDKLHLCQIEDHDARSIFDALPEFLDTTGADPPDKTQNHPRTVGFCFNSKH